MTFQEEHDFCFQPTKIPPSSCSLRSPTEEIAKDFCKIESCKEIEM